MTTVITLALIAFLFFHADLSANDATDFLPPFAPTNVPKDQGRMTTVITLALIAFLFLHADLSANGAIDFLLSFAPNQHRKKIRGAFSPRSYPRAPLFSAHFI